MRRRWSRACTSASERLSRLPEVRAKRASPSPLRCERSEPTQPPEVRAKRASPSPLRCERSEPRRAHPSPDPSRLVAIAPRTSGSNGRPSPYAQQPQGATDARAHTRNNLREQRTPEPIRATTSGSNGRPSPYAQQPQGAEDARGAHSLNLIRDRQTSPRLPDFDRSLGVEVRSVGRASRWSCLLSDGNCAALTSASAGRVHCRTEGPRAGRRAGTRRWPAGYCPRWRVRHDYRSTSAPDRPNGGVAVGRRTPR
ncbi:Uncharacterised protein [Clostridioides difficile]|nr:Uncharacterised protein [Clostridioides difficile]